jgi:uncharacterized lipoprotein YmbA
MVGAQIAALACAALLAGCGSTPPVKYYVLSSVRDAAPAAGGNVLSDKSIGVGPVVLPEYLDRPQIVVGASSNRLEFADAHRWAEPLADNFARVLQENLSLLLGTERVQSFASSVRGDYQLAVQVLRFDRRDDGVVSLVARWSVVSRDGTVLLDARRSSFKVSPSDTGVEALVSAQSEALAHLSREIAAALRRR